MKKDATNSRERKLSLEQKLKSYSMAAAAIIAAQPAIGQVVYTDVNPDVTLSATVDHLLDLNNDGITDFTIEFAVGSASRSARLSPTTGNEALGSASGLYFYPFALNFNDPIGPTQTVWNGTANGGVLTMAWIYTTGASYGNWFNTQGKFLGLRFKVGTNWHYGWARMSVDAACNSLVIMDYAYEGTVDSPITAGAGGPVGMPDNLLPSHISVFASEKVLTVDLKGFGLSNADITLVSVNGQQVFAANLTHDRHAFNVADLKAGIYLATIRSSEGTITRKVVIE